MDNLNLPPFYIGQKLVCIDDRNQYNPTIIKIFCKVFKNKTYTVKGFSICGGVLFKEFVHGFHNNGCEAGFRTNRFIPLQESTFPSLTWSKVLEKESQLISMN